MPLPRDLFAHIEHPQRVSEIGDGERTAFDPLARLGIEAWKELPPARWRAAGPAGRIAMARRFHRAICRCFGLAVSELVMETRGLGALISRDPLTDRIQASLLLIDDDDPAPLIRGLVQTACYRARDRLVRSSSWFRSSLWQRLRRAPAERGDGGGLDVLDLEPGDAARRVLDVYFAQPEDGPP